MGRDLGYLPGTLQEKMQPWLMPILDNVRHAFKDMTYFNMMIEKGDIEVAPIPYIRGRTFNNTIMIVDEAQNATIHELKTIITRISMGGMLVLDEVHFVWSLCIKNIINTQIIWFLL